MFISIILSPFVIPTLIQLKRGDYQLIKDPQNSIENNSGDLVAYFVPDTTIIATWKGWFLFERSAKLAKKIYDSMSGNILEKSVYPGWISLFAIGFAIVLKSFRKRIWPWLILSFSFWIISLGPTLFINGNPYFRGLLPFQILSMVPIFDIIRAPTRFVFLITLGTGMLVATGIAQLAKKYSPSFYKVITLLIVIIIIIEFFPLPTSLTAKDVFISSFYHDLKSDQRNFSILNIPVDFAGATGGGDIYVYAQTIHQKPIIGGYVSREPSYSLETLSKSPFLQAISHSIQYDKSSMLSLTKAGFDDMPNALKRLNVGYVILHKPLLEGFELMRVSKWIERSLGEPIFEDEWIRVYIPPKRIFSSYNDKSKEMAY